MQPATAQPHVIDMRKARVSTQHRLAANDPMPAAGCPRCEDRAGCAEVGQCALKLVGAASQEQ